MLWEKSEAGWMYAALAAVVFRVTLLVTMALVKGGVEGLRSLLRWLTE